MVVVTVGVCPSPPFNAISAERSVSAEVDTKAATFGFFATAKPIHERYGQGHRGPHSSSRDKVDPLTGLLEDPRFEQVAVLRYNWRTYTAIDLMLSGTHMMEENARVRGLRGWSHVREYKSPRTLCALSREPCWSAIPGKSLFELALVVRR